MTQSRPSLSDVEARAALDFLDLMVATGDSSKENRRTRRIPSERWDGFGPDAAAAQLPPRVTSLFRGYSWHNENWMEMAALVLEVMQDVLDRFGLTMDDDALHGALVAASYWVEGENESGFLDEASLVAIEELSGVVNGFLLSLPIRRLPGEGEAAQNRRFAAYQRRRFGAEAATGTPRQLIEKLPRSAREIIDVYGSVLLTASPDAAHAYAARLAVAIGCPIDETVTTQLSMTLATALAWQNTDSLSNAADAHPLLGEKAGVGGRLWKAAAEVIEDARLYFAELSEGSSDPTQVRCAARIPVAGLMLDADALDAIARFDEYVTLFTTWIARLEPSVNQSSPVLAFDRALRGGASSADTTRDLAATALLDCGDLVRRFATAGTSERQAIATDLATALGDLGNSNSLLRALETALEWLSKTPEHKPAAAPLPAAETNVDSRIECFQVATPESVRDLLALGNRISALVHAGIDSSDNARVPQGWWTAFHSGHSQPAAGPQQLISLLGHNANQLLERFAALLSDRDFHDANSIAQILSSKLGSSADDTATAAIAVALSAGCIWRDLDSISRGRFNDSLLGAEPSTAADGYLCGRAQTQLDSALGLLLQSTAVAA